MMERTVKVRLELSKISTIDAIYISHSHSDHFDPYTLVEIYGTYPPPEKGSVLRSATKDEELEGVLFQKSEQTTPNLSFASLAAKSADSQTFSGEG
jgi:L-ascorbate metabolism protein UlaG (beta-lactamase superfamily)